MEKPILRKYRAKKWPPKISDSLKIYFVISFLKDKREQLKFDSICFVFQCYCSHFLLPGKYFVFSSSGRFIPSPATC